MSAKSDDFSGQSLLTEGRALYAAGKFADAAARFRGLLQRDPANADAYCQLGNALCGLGQFADAAKAYAGALAALPSHAQAQHNLGVALQNLGALSEAETAFRRTLALEPNSATALCSLGFALHCLGRSGEAEDFLRASLRVDPHLADAHNNLGIVLQKLGNPTAAIACFRRAVELAPQAPQVHANLASALLRQGDYAAAEAGSRHALAIKPDFAEAHFNLGIALDRTDRHAAAESCYRTAIKLQPGLAGAHANLGLLLLGRGEFREGFQEYEWSVRTTWGEGYLPDPAEPSRPLPRPTTQMPVDWQGKRVLLLSDQGIGDEIFFLRFAPRLRAAGARLLVQPNAKFAPLLARSKWVDAVLGPGSPPPKFDLAFAISDLATLTEAADASAPPMRLMALPALVEAARNRLAAFGPPPWIGVTWRAGTGQRVSEFASLLAKAIDPALLGRALASVDARVVVLQRTPTSEEHLAFEAALGRPALNLSAANESLEEMCGLLAALDLHVGVSNTNTHLTASLGRSAHVLVPYPYDWRWMRFGAKSPWFPGFALYRQSIGGDWSDALAALQRELKI